MATRKISSKTSRKNTATVIEPTPRHLWLASLGLLVAARREGKAVANRAAAKAGKTVADARKAVKKAEADLRGGIEGVRSQVEPKVLKLSNEVEARLAPIVSKLGLKPKARRAAARKPAGKKPVARRVVRKPAKRMAKAAAR